MSADETHYTIDDFGPLPVDRPASVAELGELVRRASEAGHALYPAGGRTRTHLGHPPTRDGRVVDTRSLDAVIDYPARDMTITVGAGMTFARLQDILAAENQRLPIDVPNPERATLGGAVAVNASGPRRFGFGTLRDFVIGISAVNDLGEEIKAGGRVVKNVAGYDLCKLFVGSLGTLGVVTQLTFKVQPVPEASCLVVVPCPRESLGHVLDAVHRSSTRPTCVELLSPSMGDWLNSRSGGGPFLPGSWALVVGFEENAEAVRWQAARLTHLELPDELKKFTTEFDGGRAGELWSALRDAGEVGSGFGFKAVVRPSRVGECCHTLAELSPEPLAQIHAGNGVVHGRYADGVTLEQARRILAAFEDVTVTRCPPEWKSELPIWGRPRPDWDVMKAVKAKLDPKNIFNPGRFVGGI